MNTSFHKCVASSGTASNHVVVMQTSPVHCTSSTLLPFILLSLFCFISPARPPRVPPVSIPSSATPRAAALPHPSPFAFPPSFHMCIFQNRRARGRWIETLGSVLVVFCVFNLRYQRLVLGGRARRRCEDNAIKCGLPR